MANFPPCFNTLRLPSLFARADVDVELRNGSRVVGTLMPANESETFRIKVPAGAKLSVTVSGVKARGGSAAPVPRFAVFDDSDADVAAGRVKTTRRGAKTTRLPSQEIFENWLWLSAWPATASEINS